MQWKYTYVAYHYFPWKTTLISLTACQRCGNLGLECQYAPNCCSSTGFKDSDEFRRLNADMIALQNQVNGLCASLGVLGRSPTAAVADVVPYQIPLSEGSPTVAMSTSSTYAAVSPRSPAPVEARAPRQSSFRGPTSSFYHLNVAKKTLHDMGYQATGVASDDSAHSSEDAPRRITPTIQNLTIATSTDHSARDPLWLLDPEESIRLCHVYDEEMGDLYPVINIESLMRHSRWLYEQAESASRTNVRPQLDNIQTYVLKLVLACSLATESNGESQIGHRLFESVREIADRSLHGVSIDVKRFPMLILVVSFASRCAA